MSASKQVFQRLLPSALAAVFAIGLAGCDPGYTYYAVTVTSAQGTPAKTTTHTTAREDIENCYITICTSSPCKSGDGVENKVVQKEVLGVVAGAPGASTNEAGCSGGLTPARVGIFHYSSSRSSKDLYFTVEAFDSGNGTADNGQIQLIQSGTSSPPYGVQEELQVAVDMKPVGS